MAQQVLESRPGGRPTLEDAKRRLKSILGVARRQFLSVGYREASLEGIAREAGVAKKTLYARFGNKLGLFTAIFEDLRDSWIRELQGVVFDSEQPRVVLEAVAVHILDVATRPDMIALHRLLMCEAHRAPACGLGHYEKGAPRGMEPLARYLQAAVDDGVLKLDDVALATEQFTHLVLGGIRTRILLGVAGRPKPSERKRIARQAVQIFLAGCARSPASRSRAG